MTTVARRHLRSVPTGQPTDEDLILAAVGGDRAAFAALFRAHARYVAGVAYRALGSQLEVDDVVQETFIAAHRNLHSLQEPGALRRWLVTIAIRRVHKKLEQRKKSRELDTKLSQYLAASTDPEEKSKVEDLYEALDHIDPDLRIPWVLARIEGHSLSDVAEECGISLATTKRRIALADKRIRRRLDHG